MIVSAAPPRSIGDHRAAAGHHLDRGHAEVFVLRKDERARAAHQRDELRVGDVAAHVGAAGREGGTPGTVAHDDQLAIDAPRRFVRQLDALVGDESRGDDVVVLGRISMRWKREMSIGG